MSARTLSRWVDRLLRGQITIECPRVEILGYDHEPPVFTGPGRIIVGSDTRISFVMHGVPRDGSEAFRKIVQAKSDPYDTFRQFRVNATSYDGTEWSGGWTRLSLGEYMANVWQLSGPIRSLHTRVEGSGVSAKSGVELVFDRPLRLPLPMNMVKSVHRDGKEVLWTRSAGAKSVSVLDASIEFFRSADRDHVWAVADASPLFPLIHLENWISEPLNLLLGEVVSPRLRSRNLGDGKALISLCSSSEREADSLTANIMREDPLGAGDRFWELYREILTVIALAKDEDGHRNFEAHPLTQYYWEIIQATKGTNWVLCMTLASVVEGVVKMMFSETERRSDWPDADIDSLRIAVRRWNGNNDLRSVVINYISGFKTKGVARTLRTLLADGIITSEQIGAWEKIRNSAMHGELVAPWSDKELDEHIFRLIELTHRLSEAYIMREGKRLRGSQWQ